MGSAGSQAGVHRLSMTHVWEAAKFDDACTVPTPCLLLSGDRYWIYGVIPRMTEENRDVVSYKELHSHLSDKLFSLTILYCYVVS